MCTSVTANSALTMSLPSKIPVGIAKNCRLTSLLLEQRYDTSEGHRPTPSSSSNFQNSAVEFSEDTMVQPVRLAVLTTGSM